MNKLLLATVLTLACTVVSAKDKDMPLANQGGFTGPSASVYDNNGGYTGPSAALTTVEQALKLPDDTHVILRGYIEKHIGGKKYQFRDDTGVVSIEIEKKIWRGIDVGPTDKVELFGEIDKDWDSIEVEVDFLRIMDVSRK